MHIAIVNSEYPSPTGSDQGGIATYTYTLANTLASQGHKIELLLRAGTTSEKLHDSVTIHYYKHKTPGRLTRLLRSLNDGITNWEMGCSQHIRDLLTKIHHEGNIDIAEFPDYGGLAFACIRSLPFPVVINFHMPSEIVDKINQTELTSSRKSFHRFERKAIANGQGFRCPSMALKSEICKLYALQPSDIITIRNPVSTLHFDRISKKDNMNRFDLLFTGRLERRKGAEVLIKALPSILQLDKRIHFTLVGNSEPDGKHWYREKLERSLSAEQRTRVYLSGPLNREKLPILYRRSSIFLFPSIFENAPYSLLEAMAARLPVLASSSCGIDEIIKHNENGLLFNPQNPQDLIEKVKYALTNYQQCCMMAENAYNFLKQHHDPQKIGAQTLEFYQKVIKSKKP
ncbi:MAG: glycosyltransferase family 4 protein [Fibrobacter sp.]|jgi:glycogen(starch) synthase|nr:glycosyltransferase family 4 protein [Fibrobacter sp.]